MKKSWLLFILFISLSFCWSADYPIPNENNIFEPVSKGEIIRHTYYTLAYSEDNEQAWWVYYQLTSENIKGGQVRTDNFRADKSVSTGSATLTDYKGSGYDRGHLCPAADMKQNKTSMSETFFLSNMSPQIAGFNRGVWSKLEDQVRKWAIKCKMIYIVTGPIFKNNLGTIGENKVTIPGYYYKVIFDGNKKMIGLILPNASSSKSLDQFAVTVDQIEQLTGIDFFPGINDELETQLEGNINLSNWTF